jgi:hypothetical protein
MADFSKPMMALFDNSIAADFKQGNNIMFIMVSSSHFQVATRVDGGLGGQLACASIYYRVFLTIICRSRYYMIHTILTISLTLAAHGLEEPFFQLCCCVSFWFWWEIGFGLHT